MFILGCVLCHLSLSGLVCKCGRLGNQSWRPLRPAACRKLSESEPRDFCGQLPIVGSFSILAIMAAMPLSLKPQVEQQPTLGASVHSNRKGSSNGFECMHLCLAVATTASSSTPVSCIAQCKALLLYGPVLRTTYTASDASLAGTRFSTVTDQPPSSVSVVMVMAVSDALSSSRNVSISEASSSEKINSCSST
jgi:hypothetical protein